MSELPESTTTSTPAATTPAVVEQKPYWLYRFAAWVGIVAGIVFIVATVFFAGARFSHHGGWHGHHHHHGHPAMMQWGPHRGGPGPMGPGPMGPQGPGPGEPPSSISPPPTPPPGR